MSKLVAPPPEYITVAEYTRRKNKQRLNHDPLSPTLHFNTVTRAIDSGDIIAHCPGRRKFIDWNKYKNYPFAIYGSSK